MPFPYYSSLSSAKKRIYRASDAIENIPIKSAGNIASLSRELSQALTNSRRAEVAKQASAICRMVCEDLNIEAPIVRVKATRPSSDEEELHGLYELEEGGKPVITVWMKTAAKGQVVAFKSFVRTVLHELCHHIDYTCFKLAESFHTEGFFKRESGLYKETVPKALREKKPVKKSSRKKAVKKPARQPDPASPSAASRRGRKPEQMEMF